MSTPGTPRDPDPRAHIERGALVGETAIERIEREQREAKKREEEYTQTQVRLDQQQLKVNIGLMIFTGLLFFTSLLSGVVAILQVHVSQQAAKASQDAADASQTAADASSAAVDLQDIQMRQNRINQARQEWLQNESVEQSKLSLQASIAQSRLDQRAWIGIGGDRYTINNTDRIQDTVDIGNVGKSPAMDIVCRGAGMVRPKEHVVKESEIDSILNSGATSQHGAIMPGQGFPLILKETPLNSAVQNMVIENIQNETWLQYFFGSVTYKDIFGVDHWTHFCTIYSPILKGSKNCLIYNDTDDSGSRKPKKR